jgi:hypothetical protein
MDPLANRRGQEIIVLVGMPVGAPPPAARSLAR